jgi:hypothetical protein
MSAAVSSIVSLPVYRLDIPLSSKLVILDIDSMGAHE